MWFISMLELKLIPVRKRGPWCNRFKPISQQLIQNISEYHNLQLYDYILQKIVW